MLCFVWLGIVVVGRWTCDQQVPALSGAALGKLFTKQYFIPAQAGKVTVGLASQWPCVTDTSGTTTYGLTPYEGR